MYLSCINYFDNKIIDLIDKKQSRVKCDAAVR